MTPLALLESVKLRFNPLLHDDDTKLQALLTEALTAYQDRSGYVKRTRLQQTDSLSVTFPDDYLELVAVTDATGDWMYSDIIDGKIEIERCAGMRWPLTMEYLLKLSALDLTSGTVPAPLVGILQNYLEALIAIPNTDRLRRVSIASKLDVSNLPDQTTLYQRKVDLEVDMANRGAIPRAVAIYSSLAKG
ncbi:hypothetical protein [Pantoea sp. CCBC3-3-1]|uniref:hypothetical protein n=1 Tax=Pantoea sp. CCBC3-3-1 TaxID=2490851 RepID=UPI0011BEA6D4|nr:hypothetical protein [Pantoea sp. CCBC3-3-1]